MEKKRTNAHLWNNAIRITGGSVIVLLVLLVNGCHKESSGPSANKFLVDYKQDNLFTLQSIDALFSPLETEFPEASPIKDHASYGVQVLSITYKTHYKGAVINASGLVCLPIANEKFPIISFQNGTNTIHSQAPTAEPLNFNYMLLEAMASNGYIILIPDYIGFGASSDQVHPYYQKESTCTSVIDMLHACNELLLNKNIYAKGSDKYYLMGYSQGGWATLAILEQLENSGQTDFSITAASCGAGAYNLMAMSQYVLGLETFPGPLYLPYFVYSEQVYGSLTDPLTKYFKEPYAGIIPQLFNGNYSNTQVDTSLNDTISSFLTTDFIDNFSSGSDFQTFRNLLTLNSVSAWQVKAGLRFYHGTVDTNVPPEQSQAIYDNFISAGSDPATVSHINMEGLTHETGVIPWGIKTINWFNELQGK